MDIAHLKTFLEIYRIRHFGKSAENLCITQSAASARIKSLEERLGVPLFSRTRHAIEPTPAGHRFHKYAEMTVNGWEQARQMVALPEQYTQTLSLGCLPDSWHLFLKNWVEAIHHRIPDTALNLTIHPGHDVQKLILSGALDVGLVFEPINLPVLCSQSVNSVTLKLFANSPDVSLQEALGEGYIMVDWGASFEYEHSRSFAEFPAASIRVSHGIMALDLMTSGLRAAYLPEQVVDSDNTQLRLFPVAGAPEFERSLVAVYRAENDMQDAIKQLLQVMEQSE